MRKASEQLMTSTTKYWLAFSVLSLFTNVECVPTRKSPSSVLFLSLPKYFLLFIQWQHVHMIIWVSKNTKSTEYYHNATWVNTIYAILNEINRIFFIFSAETRDRFYVVFHNIWYLVFFVVCEFSRIRLSTSYDNECQKWYQDTVQCKKNNYNTW